MFMFFFLLLFLINSYEYALYYAISWNYKFAFLIRENRLKS